MMQTMMRAAFAAAAAFVLGIGLIGSAPAEAANISYVNNPATLDSTLAPGPGNFETLQVFLTVASGEQIDAVQVFLDLSVADLSIGNPVAALTGHTAATGPPATEPWTDSGASNVGNLITWFATASVGEPLDCGFLCSFPRPAVTEGTYLIGTVQYIANATNLTPGLNLIDALQTTGQNSGAFFEGTELAVSTVDTYSVTILPAAPEPAAMALLGMGLAGLAFVRRSASR